MAHIYHGCLALRLHMKLATTTVRRIQAPHRHAHQSWLASPLLLARFGGLLSRYERGERRRQCDAHDGRHLRLSRKARRCCFVLSVSSEKTESIQRWQNFALRAIEGTLWTAAKARSRSVWSGMYVSGSVK